MNERLDIEFGMIFYCIITSIYMNNSLITLLYYIESKVVDVLSQKTDQIEWPRLLCLSGRIRYTMPEERI